MAERRESRLPHVIVAQLKKSGIIKRTTPQTDAVVLCAGCPLAGSEKFYVGRAIKCASLPSGTVSPIVQGLAKSKFLVGRRVEKVDPRTVGRPARVLYRLSAKARSMMKGTEPLPNCQYREQGNHPEDNRLVANTTSVPTTASLAEMRRMAGANQSDLARGMGVSQSRVSDIEGADPASLQVRNLSRYTEALGGKLRLLVDFGEQQIEIRTTKHTIRRRKN